MRKLLFTIISFLMPMLAMGQILYENDFTGITEFYGWTQFDDSQTDGKVEVDPDGVAITVGIQTGQLWQPQTMVVPDGSFDLVAGGKYKVVITAKFPSNGTLQIRLGNWVNFNDAQLSITATGDYQEIVFNFDNYSVDAESSHLLFQCGDFKGTTIIKKVVVYGIGPDLCYNYIQKGKIAEVIQNPIGKYTGAVEIPAKVTHEGVEYTVNKINDRAFYDCSHLTSVEIPTSVTSIGENAFAGCCSLTSVTIPNSVTSIGNSAFSGCYSLSSVNISDLEAWCKITFEDNPLSYAHHLYLNGEEIKDLVIPNTVTSISNTAFRDCTGLTSVYIPNSITSFGNYVFQNCTGLTSVTIENGLASIVLGTFSGCTGLTTMTIPNSVTSIGNCAFQGCTGLTSMNFPNSVTSIGSYAFYGCSGLSTLVLPTNLTNISIQAFYQCSSLTSVSIPNSVERIGSQAFNECSGLTSVTVGSGIKYINSLAFANCANLEDFYCSAENVPSTLADAFDNSYVQYATLHVPASASNSYATTAPWSGFGTFETLSGETIETKKCATPTISIEDGKIKFSCETEGVEFVSNVSTTDTKDYYDAELTLTYKYKVKVYATKSGYENSDTATAEIEVPASLRGDVNKDGTVNVADHVELTKIIMNEE